MEIIGWDKVLSEVQEGATVSGADLEAIKKLITGEGLNHSSWMRALGYDFKKDRYKTNKYYKDALEHVSKYVALEQQNKEWFYRTSASLPVTEEEKEIIDEAVKEVNFPGAVSMTKEQYLHTLDKIMVGHPKALGKAQGELTNEALEAVGKIKLPMPMMMTKELIEDQLYPNPQEIKETLETPRKIENLKPVIHKEDPIITDDALKVAKQLLDNVLIVVRFKSKRI